MPQSGDSVEVGVGTGRFAAPLGVKLGIEPSPRMAQMARHRGIEVINGAAEALPLKDTSFNCVLMVTTICFLDDVEKALSETHRVLKDEGSLLIGFIDIKSHLGASYERKKENVFYREATFYSTRQVIDYMEKAGFDNLSFKQTIYDELSNIKSLQPVKNGYGQGAFVVIRGTKRGKI